MNGLTHHHEDRIIRLAGAHNFRDLGGYVTRFGDKIGTGKIYRSATLAKLTLEDREIVRGLGLRVICDFRTSAERESRPSLLPDDAAIEVWSREYEMSVGEMLAKMAAPGATAAASRQMVIESYRVLAYEQAESYRELFLRIADGPLPLLFHCSAGKDRTGIAAALLLDVLGVPRAVVIEDYVLTELFFETSLSIALHDLGSSALHGVDQPIWEPMMRAEAVYVETMFATLEERHGSVAGYCKDMLGLDDALLACLRARLVSGA